MSRRGFTLLELLIAVFIVAVIAAIVYATFASVTNTVVAARVSAEELRLREFLVRSFRTNLSAVYADRRFEAEAFRFLGVKGDDSDEENDWMRFVSTAPLMGGMALPGDLKEVRYEIVDARPSEMALSPDEGDERPDVPELLVTETPLLAGNVQELDEDWGSFVPDPEFEAPTWTVPIGSMDIQYFDGTEWVEEWDSVVVGRVPWCVHIRINFARTEEQIDEEAEENYDPLEDPDLEIVVPLAAGVGATQDARLLDEEAAAQDAAARASDDESEEQQSDADSGVLRKQ